RLTAAALTFNGGLSPDAAAQGLPLPAPLRLNGQMRLLTGRSPRMDAMTPQAGPILLPGAPDPRAPRLTRPPPTRLLPLRSLRAGFPDPDTMPRPWARAGAGAVFERHYATSSSTHYAVFSLFYGLNGHKLEAVVGAGRAPLLTLAMKANGYRMRFIAASSVD